MVRGHAGRHARARRRACADGHAQPAARDRDARASRAPISRSSRSIGGEGTGAAAGAGSTWTTRRCSTACDASRDWCTASPRTADAAAALQGAGAGWASSAARGRGRSRETPPGLLRWQHQRARRWPAAVLRRAADADPVGRGASGRCHARRPAWRCSRCTLAIRVRLTCSAAHAAIGLQGVAWTRARPTWSQPWRRPRASSPSNRQARDAGDMMIFRPRRNGSGAADGLRRDAADAAVRLAAAARSGWACRSGSSTRTTRRSARSRCAAA